MSSRQQQERALARALDDLAEDAPSPTGDLYGRLRAGAARRRRAQQVVVGAGVLAVLAVGVIVVPVLTAEPTPRTVVAAGASGTPADCPARADDWTAGPQRQGSELELVPPGAVVARVCRYQPLPPATLPGGTDQPLVRSGLLTGAPLATAVRALDGARRGVMHCPANSTTTLLLRFHYPSGPDVDVRMGAAGCRNSTNGALNAVATGVEIPGYTD
ncbi:hypothetical protein GCM10009665_33150 [Kitasatospora nipponensis]|uniref:Serine/threonine protein kinase n=1 Tax=Kitasatospora nipponensis TaxID=258049 RepID=A0ABN1W7Z6_9ACTN